MLLRASSLVLLLPYVASHGSLTTPITRRGNTGCQLPPDPRPDSERPRLPSPPWRPEARARACADENDPVPSNTADAFVCRHAARNALVPYHAITAGGST